MTIYRRESGSAVEVIPHLFEGEANVYLNDADTVVPIHTALQIYEDYEHNDLTTYYSEMVAGDFDAYEIQQNIVRSGSYALRIRYDINENNRIVADRSLINTPEAGDSFRIWFYHDGSLNDHREMIYDFALDNVSSPQVEEFGGYQLELKAGDVRFRVYTEDGTHLATKAHTEFPDSNLPNHQWNYFDMHWNNSEGNTVSNDQIGWQLYTGDGTLVASDVAKNEDRYPNRNGYYHKMLSGAELDVYIDDLQYI